MRDIMIAVVSVVIYFVLSCLITFVKARRSGEEMHFDVTGQLIDTLGVTVFLVAFILLGRHLFGALLTIFIGVSVTTTLADWHSVKTRGTKPRPLEEHIMTGFFYMIPFVLYVIIALVVCSFM